MGKFTITVTVRFILRSRKLLEVRCTYELVVKVIWHTTASPPQTDGSIVFAYSPSGTCVPSHVDTLAPPSEYDWTCASFGPPEFTIQTEIDRFSRSCTAHGRKSLYLQWVLPSPKFLFRLGIWTPTNTWFLRLPES